MKHSIFLSIVFSTLTIFAQTPPPSSPAQQAPVRIVPAQPQTPVRIVPTQPQVPGRTVPVQPGVIGGATPVHGAVSNVVPGNMLSNRFSINSALSNAIVFSNLFNSGNIGLNDVDVQFQNLQLNIQQALQILSSLTAGGALNTGNVNTGNTTTTSTTGSGQGNIGTAGVGGINVGQGNTTVVGQNPTTTTTAPNQSGSRTSPFLPASPILPSAANPAQGGVAQGQIANTAAGQTFVGTLGPNTFQMDQQTFQLLLLLQNNLQQAVPILQNLNNSTAGDASFITGVGSTTGSTSGFTNRFIRIPQNRGVLMPTGR